MSRLRSPPIMAPDFDNFKRRSKENVRLNITSMEAVQQNKI